MPVKKYLAIFLIAVTGIVLFPTPPDSNNPHYGVAAAGLNSNGVNLRGPAHRGSDDNTCEQIQTNALTTVQNVCNAMSSNSICYANRNVTAEPRPGKTLKFSNAGDKVAVEDISRLVTSPLDAAKGTWGISVMKLRANLPDTLPGQNVTFVAFGETSIQNVSGDMQAFYFSSGLGPVSCQNLPADGIVVRSPQHTAITFTVNGVQVTMASTVLLRAQPNMSMSIQLVEGSAQVVSAGVGQSLQPGEMVSVVLGGANGLTAISSPTKPLAIAVDPTLVVIINILIVNGGLEGTPIATASAPGIRTPAATLPATVSATATATMAATAAATGPATPGGPGHGGIIYTAIVIEGPVESIDSVTIAIYGQKIRVRGDDPVRRRLKIGDWVRISGNFDRDDQQQIIIVAVVVIVIDAPSVIIVVPNAPVTQNNPGNQGHSEGDDGHGKGKGKGHKSEGDDD